MREGAKQRLVGATVIVALAVIFVPMFFEKGHRDDLPPIGGAVPEAPAFDPNIKSEVFLGPGDSGVGGLDSSQLTDSQPLALPASGDPEPAPTNEAPVVLEPPPPEPADEDAQPAGRGQGGPASAESAQVAPEPVPVRGASDGMPSWVIQVASVATREGAAQLESKLKAGGFSAFVEKAEVNGKLYYRVRVGPEVDRARAEQTAASLRTRFKLDTLIKNYP
jgi:DedD protein